MQPLFVAKRPFDPSAGEAWDRFVAWSGLTQLKEVVTLDTMLCPTLPEELTPAETQHPPGAPESDGKRGGRDR